MDLVSNLRRHTLLQGLQTLCSSVATYNVATNFMSHLYALVLLAAVVVCLSDHPDKTVNAIGKTVKNTIRKTVNMIIDKTVNAIRRTVNKVSKMNKS